ncbi:oligosaccharide flippase family protein [Winogradskyella psychrotolerans]|uniref:oligosaccharide flippase family protein n=1 Tax=Winogradskyella psychrotolerans TaxID=1344585 RepID=UPI001C077F43|nr:oligosaccharide flippase family protein [Winogradskyella psychrotolerans]MBU2927582.1 oligosaccharide flippase family protein [Winogradskyella psychrotolerans]
MVSDSTKSIISGSFWMMLQTVSLKVISFFSQILLALILMPEVFGKVALVTAITNITFITQQFGIQDVLIRRGKAFGLWYETAKSLTLFVSIIAFVISLLIGWLYGYFTNDLEISLLVLILSFSLPFQALSILPNSKLRINLEFKFLAQIKVVELLSIQVGIILLALLDFGVYSFVYPVLFVAIINCLYLYYKTNIQFNFKLHLRKWRILFNDSLYGFYFALASRTSFQIDYIILGFFATQAEVGLYFMAFTIAVQAIGLLAANLPSVIFPTLNKIKLTNIELGLKLQTLIIVLSIFGAILTSWQFFCAEYLVHLFLSEKWFSIVNLIQILSLGMFFRILSSQWVVPLKLNGEFDKLARIAAISLVVMVALLFPLAYFYKALGIAYGVSIYYFVISFYQLYKSLKNYEINLLSLFLKTNMLLGFSLIAFYGSHFLAEYIIDGSTKLLLVIKLVITSVIGLLFFVIMLRLFHKQYYFTVADKIKSLKK